MEMLRLLSLTLALWATTALADTNTDVPFPFNCSMRLTCSNLRLRVPNKNEAFNAKLVNANRSTLFFNLTNKRGDALLLTISGVVNQRFRVIIEEHDRHRYKLEYSLEKEPTLKTMNFQHEMVSNFSYLPKPTRYIGLGEAYIVMIQYAEFPNLTVNYFTLIYNIDEDQLDSVFEINVISSTKQSVVAEDNEGNRIIVRTTPLTIEFYHNRILETVLEGNRIIFENTKESQAFTFSVRFAGAAKLMGLHEHTDHLTLRHTADFSIDPYRLKNIDYGAFEYKLNTTRSMYGSIPVIYGFGNASSGIFHHNAAEQWIDINTTKYSAYFMVDGGRLDLFVLLGPTLKDAVRQYVDLTGKPHLPQLWALGYHQSRWAYGSAEDVMDTIKNFDKYNFPMDVLWLDINYTTEFKWFTWNPNTFADPIKLLNWVDAQGHRKLVTISDPHIKVDLGYKIYTDMLERALFVNDSTGLSPFFGECWPGNSTWIDYLNPAARDYYANLHLYKNFPSTPALGGFWNDMNEPALFDNISERTFPFDNVHYGGVRHRDIHNMYGMLQTMSTHKGLIARDNGTVRPFILSRAYFAGSQRYANKWGGDNWGLFEDLRFSVPMALTSNLVGLAFYGADIPGFSLNVTDELLIRWYQIGIWLPFFRAHANLQTSRREPFRFGNATQSILRDVLQLRYKHLPYWYTLFYEHTRTGDPIVRPLLYQYPNDTNVYDLDDEFLIGSDILTASVYKSNATSVSIYFPGAQDSWVQITGRSLLLHNGGSFANIPVDITFTPVFYRVGSIIIRKPNVLRTTADIKNDPLELHAVIDKNGIAKTRIYIDDYESFKYANEKQYIYLDVTYDDKNKNLTTVTVDKDNKPGNFTFDVKTIIVYVGSTGNTDSTISMRKYHVDHAGRKLTTLNCLENPIHL